MRRQLLISFAAATAAVAISGIVTASADPGFTCANKSGGVAGAPGTVSALRVAHHDGYDRLVFEFAPTAAGAVPEYSLTRQNSSSFTRDASGQTVRLDGSAGIRTVFRNTSVGSGVPSDVKSGLPAIREVANIGDFERVTSYGIGLSSAACFRVLELSGPTRLVLDVQTAPDAVPSAAPVSTTAAPSAAPATQASDTTPSDLASTGHPSAPSQPAGLPLAQIALALLVLTGGLALAGLRLVTRR
jgi:hypothetical protein